MSGWNAPPHRGITLHAPPSALASLVADEWSRIVRALTLYVGDREAARDLAQEAFVRAADRWRRVSVMDRPGAWVQRVAFNLATDHLRRRGRERHAVQRLAAGSLEHAATTDVAGRADLSRALATLDREARAVVVLRYVVGLSSGEVGERLDRPAATVRSIAARALAQLREHVDVVLSDEESADVH